MMGAWIHSAPLAKSRSGFTLIEVLVTVAVFSLALTVLIAGLRGGVRAHQSVLRHQAGRAADTEVLRQIREDLRQVLVVAEGVPPLVETSIGAGEEQLEITTSTPRALLRAGQGGLWRTVGYQVGEGPEGGRGLLRTESVFVAEGVPFGQSAPPNLLVPDATAVSFEYVAEGITSPLWADTARLPSAVVITVTRSGFPPLKSTVYLPGSVQKGSR